MPKYYCDYCDSFLTHDSPSVRKTHNGGRKHKDNVRAFYQKWMEDQAQKLVDAHARAFAGSQVRSALANPSLLGAPMAPMVPPVGAPRMAPFGAFPVPGMPGMMPRLPPVGLIPMGPQPMMPPNQFRGGF